MRLHHLLIVAALSSATFAQAATITFSGAPTGSGFTGPVTEAGFTYSLHSGNLYINGDGNPGSNLEPNESFTTGGILEIVSQSGTPFDFNGIDVASTGVGSITVHGWNGSTIVGSDAFLGADTGLPGTYITYSGDYLDNLTALYITLPGAPETAVDNIVLTPAAPTPEPSSLGLLATGLLGMGAVMKRRFA